MVLFVFRSFLIFTRARLLLFHIHIWRQSNSRPLCPVRGHWQFYLQSERGCFCKSMQASICKRTLCYPFQKWQSQDRFSLSHQHTCCIQHLYLNQNIHENCFMTHWACHLFCIWHGLKWHNDVSKRTDIFPKVTVFFFFLQFPEILLRSYWWQRDTGTVAILLSNTGLFGLGWSVLVGSQDDEHCHFNPDYTDCRFVFFFFFPFPPRLPHIIVSSRNS